MDKYNPIGVFDSGYGGLTILKDIHALLPQYDYLYLGDNARAPYGNRSFETVYEYTLQSVKWFFEHGCQLVILACNTASAKALRTIQQNDLPQINVKNRVLGVIRPTSEVIGILSHSKSIGILGTTGTIRSNSYKIEINNFFPEIKVYQQDCPMWVPLIENNEYDNPGADFFIKKDMDRLLKQSPNIDAILLACTHYPLIMSKIVDYLPKSVKIISQGTIVAESLKNYLHRHQNIQTNLSQNHTLKFFTTDDPATFDDQSVKFFGKKVKSEQTFL